MSKGPQVRLEVQGLSDLPAQLALQVPPVFKVLLEVREALDLLAQPASPAHLVFKALQVLPVRRGQ